MSGGRLTRFVAHTVFDLRREGFVMVDNDESILNQSSSKSQKFTPIDERTVAAIHNEMEDIINESASKSILKQSNKFRSKWICTILLYIFTFIPLNVFLMLYSTKTNDIFLFISSIIVLIITLTVIYKMEYYFQFSVYSFLSWNTKSIILLRNFADTKFNKNNKYSNHDLKCGISYDTKTGLYQLIAHHHGDGHMQEEKQQEKQREFILYYRFNEDYITPIIYESFDFKDIENKGIEYYHLWSKFVQELFIIFDKFHAKFDVENSTDCNDDTSIELNVNDNGNGNAEIFNSINSRMRIKLVSEYRLNKVRQSTLKQSRRLFIIFGLCLIIGVPLIVADDHESMASYNNISTWILTEGILFFIFTLLTMPLCCGFYQHHLNCNCCFTVFNKFKIRQGNKNNEVLINNYNEENDEHDAQLIDIKNEENKKLLCCGDSSLWIDCIISEIDDFCNDLNSKYSQKYTFRNQTGYFDAPNGEPYTGKITINSVSI